MHPRLAVAIGHIDIPVRRNGDAGRLELLRLLIDARYFGIILLPLDFTIERAFGELIERVVCEVEVFGLAFLVQRHAVCAAPKLFAPRFDELALWIEYDYRIFAVSIHQHAP